MRRRLPTRGSMAALGRDHLRPPRCPPRGAREFAPGLPPCARRRHRRPRDRRLAERRRRGRVRARPVGAQRAAPVPRRGEHRRPAGEGGRAPARRRVRRAGDGFRPLRRREGDGGGPGAARGRPALRRARTHLGLQPAPVRAPDAPRGAGGQARALDPPPEGRRTAGSGTRTTCPRSASTPSTCTTRSGPPVSCHCSTGSV